jgi:hypothetical protein
MFQGNYVAETRLAIFFVLAIKEDAEVLVAQTVPKLVATPESIVISTLSLTTEDLAVAIPGSTHHSEASSVFVTAIHYSPTHILGSRG